MPDQPAEEHKRLSAVRTGQGHHAGEHAWQLDHRHVLQHFAPPWHLQAYDQVERLVQQLREGMRRIDGQGGQHAAHLRPVIIFQPPEIIRGHVGEVQDANPGCLQRGSQLVAPAGILVAHHPADTCHHRAEHLARRETIGRAFRPGALHLLLEPGDADLKELVEVGTDDAKELQPLEQRIRRVERFIEHPLVELEPAQFTVNEMRGREGD